MPATHFENFNRDNGLPVTVEYSYLPGSETTYSPMYGACGGDGCEVEIVGSWPNTAAFERLHARRTELTLRRRPLWQWPLAWLALQIIDLAIWFQERSAHLSTEERERMEASIAEHHVYEPYEEDYL